MRLCTKVLVRDSHVDEDGAMCIDDFEIMEVSLVAGDHGPGFDADGFLHIQAPRDHGARRVLRKRCPWYLRLPLRDVIMRGIQ